MMNTALAHTTVSGQTGDFTHLCANRKRIGTDIFCILLLFALALSTDLPLLTKYPPPGGDEPGFVDPAATFATKGYIGTRLYLNELPGMDRHVYWQPPLYFVTLGTWFKVFGVGLVQARAFSVLCGLLVSALVYLLSRRYTSPAYALIATGLCVVSFWLAHISCYARMDVFCISLILASSLLYLMTDGMLAAGVRASSAGLLAGLAFLTHPLGIVAAISILIDLALRRRRDFFRWVETRAFVGAFSLCAAAWIAYIGQDVRSFELQMRAQAARKLDFARFLTGSYWWQFYIARTHLLSLALMSFCVAWLAVKSTKLTSARYIVILAGVSFACATCGREATYFAYFVPSFCIAVAIYLEHTKLSKPIAAAILLAYANELVLYGHSYLKYGRSDYTTAARAIQQTIPSGKKVFDNLAAVTPYFAVYGRDEVCEAPPVPLPDGLTVADAAMACDYVAVSSGSPFPANLQNLLGGRVPVLKIDEGPDCRVTIYRVR